MNRIPFTVEFLESLRGNPVLEHDLYLVEISRKPGAKTYHFGYCSKAPNIAPKDYERIKLKEFLEDPNASICPNCINAVRLADENSKYFTFEHLQNIAYLFATRKDFSKYGKDFTFGENLETLKLLTKIPNSYRFPELCEEYNYPSPIAALSQESKVIQALFDFYETETVQFLEQVNSEDPLCLNEISLYDLADASGEREALDELIAKLFSYRQNGGRRLLYLPHRQNFSVEDDSRYLKSLLIGYLKRHKASQYFAQVPESFKPLLEKFGGLKGPSLTVERELSTEELLTLETLFTEVHQELDAEGLKKAYATLKAI